MFRSKSVLSAAAAVLALTIWGCSEVANREDFAAALRDKSEDQVMKYAGKPADTDRSDPNHVVWIYKERTFDVPTRRTDPETDVVFAPGADGKLHVVEVVFK